jgi:archaellin
MSAKGRGLAGLDALIMLVALLLVVFVAASALLTTVQSLMRRDQDLQKQKADELQQPIVVEYVRARDNDGDKELDEFRFTVRLRHGDNPVNLNTSIITVASKALDCGALQYGVASTTCSYTISYGKYGEASTHDMLQSGDLIDLVYDGPAIVPNEEDTSTYFTFVPEKGQPTKIKVHVPARISTQNMIIWPLK